MPARSSLPAGKIRGRTHLGSRAPVSGLPNFKEELMRKIAKFLAVMLALALAAIMLCGCASSTTEPESSFTLPNGLIAPTLTPGVDSGD